MIKGSTIQSVRAHIQRFAREDSGTASVEFILVMPIYITVIVMGVELGLVTMRHTLLERGMDIAVREIRLGTGTAPQHDDIKDLICANSLMLLDCKNKLQLEMRSADIRSYAALDTSADCTDSAEPSKPVRDFTPGQQNELMLMRACLKFEPLFPDAFLGSALDTDASGEASVIVTSAFVQEPL
ncbi:MAG: TadE/TadG family type IV pilus assembly protein [Pseudomonadota bacterium]